MRYRDDGGGAYVLIPDGYISVAPPGTNMYLRIQNSGFGTMSISELALGDSYLVSYYAVNRNESAKNDFKVSVDGEVKIGGPLFTVAGANVWTNQVSGTNLAFNFTSTGTTATLTFDTLKVNDTVFFDAWRVTDLGPAYRGTVLKLY